MSVSPLGNSLPTGDPNNLARASWALVLTRAMELAVRRGKLPHEVSIDDWDQAAASLTGILQARSLALDGDVSIRQRPADPGRWPP